MTAGYGVLAVFAEHDGEEAVLGDMAIHGVGRDLISATEFSVATVDHAEGTLVLLMFEEVFLAPGDEIAGVLFSTIL